MDHAIIRCLPPNARPLVLEHLLFRIHQPRHQSHVSRFNLPQDLRLNQIRPWKLFHVLLQRLSPFSCQFSYSHVHHLNARTYVDQSIKYSNFQDSLASTAHTSIMRKANTNLTSRDIGSHDNFCIRIRVLPTLQYNIVRPDLIATVNEDLGKKR